MPYVENIKVGSGETWPIRDKEGRELIADIWSTIYPVGSIYMSVNNTNPEVLFGGEWEQIQDTFLLAAGNKHVAGSTGGEETHTLTVPEIAEHQHKLSPLIRNSGGQQITTGAYYTIIHSNDQLVDPNTTVNISYVDAGITAVTGGNQPHNNMPPYLAVYMWQRTA